MTFLAVVGALAVVGVPLWFAWDEWRCRREWRRYWKELEVQTNDNQGDI